jgi:hypothetical protein
VLSHAQFGALLGVGLVAEKMLNRGKRTSKKKWFRINKECLSDPFLSHHLFSLHACFYSVSTWSEESTTSDATGSIWSTVGLVAEKMLKRGIRVCLVQL